MHEVTPKMALKSIAALRVNEFSGGVTPPQQKTCAGQREAYATNTLVLFKKRCMAHT